MLRCITRLMGARATQELASRPSHAPNPLVVICLVIGCQGLYLAVFLDIQAANDLQCEGGAFAPGKRNERHFVRYVMRILRVRVYARLQAYEACVPSTIGILRTTSDPLRNFSWRLRIASCCRVNMDSRGCWRIQFLRRDLCFGRDRCDF